MLSGVVKSVDSEVGSGQIQPDGDGEVHTFDLKKLEGKAVTEGQVCLCVYLSDICCAICLDTHLVDVRRRCSSSLRERRARRKRVT